MLLAVGHWDCLSGEDSNLQAAVTQVENWAASNKMELNADKTKALVISYSKQEHNFSPVTINSTQIEQVTTDHNQASGPDSQ